MKSKTAYIFVNGNLEDCKFLVDIVSDEDLIVASDGGIEMVYRLGMTPDIVVGDFDSTTKLPDEVLKTVPSNHPSEVLIDGVSYFKYPTDKNFLDSELAIDHAISDEATAIKLVNTIGDELDHLIGTIFILGKAKYTGIDLRIVSAKQEISYQTGTIELRGEVGQKVSFIPINGEVIVKSSAGLKYDPSKHTMSMQDNIGTRNELTSKSAEVVVRSGSFLVVENL